MWGFPENGVLEIPFKMDDNWDPHDLGKLHVIVIAWSPCQKSELQKTRPLRWTSIWATDKIAYHCQPA